MNKTYYQILGLDPHASAAEIKRAYKKLARVYHPDLNPRRKVTATDRFKLLHDAYQVPSHAGSREQYDRSLGLGQSITGSNIESVELIQTRVGNSFGAVDIYDEPKRHWLTNIRWRRKLAVVLWALCLLGSFLSTSSSVIVSVDRFAPVSLIQRLIWITVPLGIMWIGSWLADNEVDTLNGSMFADVIASGRTIIGRILGGFAWVLFARFIGLYLLGPLILLIS